MMVALTGIEPVLFALRGRRVNQLHHSAQVVTDDQSGLHHHCTMLRDTAVPCGIEANRTMVNRSVIAERI